ncbi:conserved hypothetical protein [Vibrio nigripulchritudo SFn27]|uniref:Aminopeptidase n=1 Tax=Vibrio nigripulchritudo TaxID=28173 RepID=U4KHQ8_9VIBR|nr:DUF3630 family protein [Vibrio nigripulchritudo]CCN82171.1 conserved hypothetical protein [Vibrio nigripulchritudo BLFn1]CCN90790.1 conserved hypothetical protein [Vibrio nigripulchritudo SFn27]CCN93140.1 conserved hypothetical protein [Vibrio nigripulchritudo ENn2]CCO41505.1 conserved hypothetical protein [Vibrio nigripulchritudo SFn135]CCO53217.1 conserved hypothetical protein [Vibrio nigripulchritudo Wn13]
MADYGLMEYQREEGRIILTTPRFDYDSFPELGDKLVKTLSASVVEKQWDADIHSWLIDFEGCQLFLKSEHYSESVWLEVLNKDENQEELDYLAGLFEKGFDAI